MRTLALILLSSLLCGCYAQRSILKPSRGQRCRGRDLDGKRCCTPETPGTPLTPPAGTPLTRPAGQRCRGRRCREMIGRKATCKYCPADMPICNGFGSISFSMLTLWEQSLYQYGESKIVCAGIQFRYQYQKGGGEQNTPRYGGSSSSCQIGREHIIQNGQGNIVPITQIKVCADSFINKIVFTLNDGSNFTCGQSETGTCGTMKPNNAGQDYNFIYLEGKIWQFRGQEYFSNIVSSWIKG